MLYNSLQTNDIIYVNGGGGDVEVAVELVGIRLQQDVSGYQPIHWIDGSIGQLLMRECTLFTKSNAPEILGRNVNTMYLNIRDCYFWNGSHDYNIDMEANTQNVYASIRNTIFILNPGVDGASHIIVDNNNTTGLVWLTLSDITFYASNSSTYMVFDSATSGNTAVDSISPIVGNSLTLGSNGATMVDTVGMGWIVGNKKIQDPTKFDR
jgi:hypothetical protein